MRRVLAGVMIVLLLMPSAAWAVTDMPNDPSSLNSYWITEAEQWANGSGEGMYDLATATGRQNLADVLKALQRPPAEIEAVTPSLWYEMKSAFIAKGADVALAAPRGGQLVAAGVVGTAIGWGGQEIVDWATGAGPQYYLEDGTQVTQWDSVKAAFADGKKVYMYMPYGAIQKLYDDAGGKWDTPPPWAIAANILQPSGKVWDRLGQSSWPLASLGSAPTAPTRGVGENVMASGDGSSQTDADMIADSLTRSLHGDQSGPILSADVWSWSTYNYWAGGYNQRVVAPSSGAGVRCAVCGQQYVAFSPYATSGQQEVMPTIYWDSRTSPSKPGYRIEWSWKDVYQIVQHLNTHGDWRSWYKDPAPSVTSDPSYAALPAPSDLPRVATFSSALGQKIANGTATSQDYVDGLTAPNVIPKPVEEQIGRPNTDNPGEGIGAPTADPSTDTTSAIGVVGDWANKFWGNASDFTKNLFYVSDNTVKARITPAVNTLKGNAEARWPFGMATLPAHIAPSIEAGGSDPMEWFLDLDPRPDSEAGAWLRPLEFGARWIWLRWVFSAAVGIAFLLALRELLTPRVNV